jgi:hypothetical protein
MFGGVPLAVEGAEGEGMAPLASKILIAPPPVGLSDRP